MHYCTLLFTKELPSEEEVSQILAPYSEEDFYDNDDGLIPYPIIVWDWYQTGGRYSASLKLDTTQDGDTYRWEYFEHNPRNNRLFVSTLLSTLQRWCPDDEKWRFHEENYFDGLGYRDGYIRVDGAKISDLVNAGDVDCYQFIDSNGIAHARSSWDREKFVENAHFEEELEQCWKNNADGFVTVLDLHG